MHSLDPFGDGLSTPAQCLTELAGPFNSSRRSHMTAAARTNAFITASTSAETQALQHGRTSRTSSETEAPPPLIPLSESTGPSPARLETLKPTLPGAAPEEPQVQVVRLHQQQALQPSKDHASAAVPAETKSQPQQQPQWPAPVTAALRQETASPRPPQRAEMQEPQQRQLQTTLRCGDGSESCENCCHITAGLGVGLLAGSLGLWALQCPYEVPFAIAGGTAVGAGVCHWYAQQLSCIPELGWEWR